jgi:hypothetical protein
MIVKISELQPGDVINPGRGYIQTVVGVTEVPYKGPFELGSSAWDVRVVHIICDEPETYTVRHNFNSHMQVVSRTDES